MAQTAALLKGTAYIATTLTFDDAYYYLLTAWNFTRLGFPSFDGLHPTNGVQLLWYWLVLILAQVAPTKSSLLFLAMTLCFLFNAAGQLVIWGLAERLNRPMLGLYMASFWFFLTFGSEFYSTGMENSLHAFVFWLVIWQTIALLTEPDGPRKNTRFIFLTVLLVLNVWARLDAAIFSSILYLYCLLKLDRPLNYKYILASGLLALAGLIIQLTAFYQMGGTWLPVSSLVKQSRADWSHLSQLAAARLIPAVILLVPLELLIARYTRPITALRGVWYSLLLGVILHLLVTMGINAYILFLWYLSPPFVFVTISLAYFADGLAQIVSNFAPVTRRILPPAVCLPLILLAIFFFYVRLTIYIPTYKLGYQTALWASEHLPAEARLGSWNAGILGYFSERPVINLDGLINDADYYNRVITGPLPWPEYVRQQEIDYIIDYNRSYMTSPDFPLIEVFSLPDQPNEVLMWQVLPGK